MQIGMGPSPMLYFATHYLDVDGGIQVTGSHNPADYNGFKMLLKGRSVFGAGDPGARPARRRRRLERGQRARVEEVDIREAYVDRLLAGLLGQGRSASAGTPATAPRGRSSTCWSSGCRASITSIFTEVDGRFPNHHPDPTVEANLADLKAARRRQAARLRHRLRRRRRPHRRGRRQGPRDLGRPAAADPRRAGARRSSRARRSSPTSRRARCCSTASPSSAASR